MASKKQPKKKPKRPTYYTQVDPRNFPRRRQSKYVRAMIERDQTVRDLRTQVHELETRLKDASRRAPLEVTERGRILVPVPGSHWSIDATHARDLAVQLTEAAHRADLALRGTAQ